MRFSLDSSHKVNSITQNNIYPLYEPQNSKIVSLNISISHWKIFGTRVIYYLFNKLILKFRSINNFYKMDTFIRFLVLQYSSTG